MTNGPDAAMTTPDTCSCEDYGASRRSFLKGLAAAAGGAVTVTAFGDTFRQVAYAGTTDNNVLVVLSLRGGADSLSIVVPHGERAYNLARPRIAVPQGALLDGTANSMFGLHPALAPVGQMWKGGRMAAVVATGLPVANRSHFAAMEEVEDADPGSSARSGWINRLVGLDTDSRAQEAVSLGSAMVPGALWGNAPVLAVNRVKHLDLPGPSDPEKLKLRRRSLDQLWGHVRTPLGAGARNTLVTTTSLGKVANQQYKPAPGAKYPQGPLGTAMMDTAQLIKANVGAEVITLDHGSWDMHRHVGEVGNKQPGTMSGMLGELAQAIAALFEDLGDAGSRVTLVTITEFGRRISENGSGGLDHGWGNAMLLFGAGVRGGQYYGKWPGLGPNDLVEGDLKVTTDYRSVLWEVLQSRFNPSMSKVFPGFQPAQSVGVMG